MCSNQNVGIEKTFTSDLINPTMLASEKFDAILEQVKNSCLNFQIQESPFSAIISLKKSFIKDRSGNLLLPASNHHGEQLIDKNTKLEHEVMVLRKMYEDVVSEAKVKLEVATNNEQQLKAEIKTLKNNIKNRDDEIGNLKNALKTSKDVSDKLNKTLNENRENIKREKEQLTKEHIIEIKAWKKEVADEKNENMKLKQQCVVKDDELQEAFNEKVKLEEKLSSLLDVLYGCPECGLNNCECDESGHEESSKPEGSRSNQHCTSQPSPPPSPTAQLTPSLSSGLSPSPWTPPPTPPCTSCGGINFGPSPSNLCFICIPPDTPLQSNSPHYSSSPSRTPPGTPPTVRLESAVLRNQDLEHSSITPACRD